MSSGDSLPPLILRCRALWGVAFSAAAAALLGVGLIGVSGWRADLFPSWAPTWVAPVLLLLGSGGCYFVVRFCFARLLLDEGGFRLVGPILDRRVAWNEIVHWERRIQRGGPATLRIIHGSGRSRLLIPLIYRDAHLLELGLRQRGFPRY